MRTKFSILVLLFVAITLSAQDTLRIMTYNIASGQFVDMPELGEYFQKMQADIVLLQEVELRTYRPEAPLQGGKNQMAELGYYTDMLPVFGKTNLYPTGGYYGLGILSQYHIIKLINVDLPQVVDKNEPRSMLVATWDINGTPLTIATTHLSLDSRNREVQMKYIRKYMRKIKGIKFICGDLNSSYVDGVVVRIFNKWNDALPYKFTYPFPDANWKLDWMLYEKKAPVEIIASDVDDSCGFSDHLPCYTDIVINAKK